MQICAFRRWKVAFAVAAMTVVVCCSRATAQEVAISRQLLTQGSPQLSKVTTDLLRARHSLRAAGREEQAADPAPTQGIVASTLVQTRDGQADIELSFATLTPAILQQIVGLGMEVKSYSEPHSRIDGWLDMEKLEQVAAINEVVSIRPNYGFVTWGVPAVSQADVSINADDARSVLSIDGTGVTIGILSDSFNHNRGGSYTGGACDCSSPGNTCNNVVIGMTNQDEGELPDSVTILDDCSSCGGTKLKDEGAAMAELIHDLAPGANLMFHSAANSFSDFATGITELANCGADIIVDDVIYFLEAMFQDDLMAQAAQAAADSGVAYFSSAGNSGTFGVRDTFADSHPATDSETIPDLGMGQTPTGNGFHDFGGGDRFAAVTIPPGCNVTFILQWNEPYFAPTVNLDLYQCTGTTPSTCTFAGQGAQACMAPGSGFGVESLVLTNTGDSAKTEYIAVEHVCGSENLEFRIATFAGSGCGFPGAYDFEDGQDAGVPDANETPIFVDPQIYGHAAAEGAIAVAAIDYREIDSGGTFQDPAGELNVEPFSSLGGALPFYFDAAGSPLASAPQLRMKPDVAAPDGTDNSFFGSDTDSSGFPNFFGTSAAAPHAAAVAALMQDAGNLSPSGIVQVLGQTGIDWESAGYDFLSGESLVDGLRSAGTTHPVSGMCYVDDLILSGKPNLATGGAINQRFRTCTSLEAGGGDFSGVEGLSPASIFTDGFESGDTSAWRNN